MFLICDAPCHGKQYHQFEKNSNYDMLHDKIQPNTLENLMQEYAQLASRCSFSCLSINGTTKKMFYIMKENFELHQSQTKHFLIEPVNKHEDVYKVFDNSLVKSVSTRNPTRTYQYLKAKCYKLQFPELLDTDHYKTRAYWQSFKNKISFTINDAFVKIDEQPRPQKLESDKCSIYQLIDITNDVPLKMLVKLSTQQKEIKDDQYARSRLLNIAYAYQLARYFRKDTKKLANMIILFYVPPVLYELD